MLVQNFNTLKGANTNVSPFLMPEGTAVVLNGCNPTYKLGALIKDLGYSRVSTQIENSKSITGLFNFRQVPGTEKMLATVNDADGDDDTQLFYKTAAGAWTEIAGAEATWNGYEDINVEMENFIGYRFFVGYGDTDGFLPVGSLTGTTWSDAVNVTNMPGAKYIKRYRDRLYLGNCDSAGTAYPYRVYFSSVPSAGAITWTVASDFIDVDYSEQITGLGENWDRLVIFTEYSAYIYNQEQKKKVWDIGCSNHRTIRTQGEYMFWANRDGVWLSVSGGYPQNIAGNVIDFFRNGTPNNFFAELIDEEYILYVGDVTVNGVAYSNTELIFNIPTQTWRWRENTDNMTIFARFNDSGKLRRYMGDDDGNVWDKSKYTDTSLVYTDTTVSGTGVSIAANFELAPMFLGDVSFNKRIKEIHAFAERAGGLKLKYRVVDKNSRALTEYIELGELTQYVSTFDVETEGGVLLQVAGSEYGSNPFWSFFGFAMDVEKQSDILN